MPWIESHSELRDHPKSKRMKRKLKISEHETVGLLHYFWYWALEFAQDGDITSFTSEDIADGCRFTGDPDELISALIHAGFVDEVDGIKTIHDWFKHGGKLVVWRNKEKERAKSNREKTSKKSVNTESVQRTDDVRTADVHPYVPTSNSNSKNKEKDIKDIVVKHDIPYSEIIDYLNEKSGKNYKINTKKTKELINGRWKDGFRLNDFQIVIDKKCSDWIGTSMEEYLRPSTLFNAEKFEGYVNHSSTSSSTSVVARTGQAAYKKLRTPQEVDAEEEEKRQKLYDEMRNAF